MVKLDRQSEGALMATHECFRLRENPIQNHGHRSRLAHAPISLDACPCRLVWFFRNSLVVSSFFFLPSELFVVWVAACEPAALRSCSRIYAKQLPVVLLSRCFRWFWGFLYFVLNVALTAKCVTAFIHTSLWISPVRRYIGARFTLSLVCSFEVFQLLPEFFLPDCSNY